MDTSYDPKAKPNAVIRRIKQNVTQDMLSSLRDTLSNEIREDIESLSQTVTSTHREYHADGEAVIRDIFVKIDSLLAKSWEITHSTPTAEHISEIHKILQKPPPN